MSNLPEEIDLYLASSLEEICQYIAAKNWRSLVENIAPEHLNNARRVVASLLHEAARLQRVAVEAKAQADTAERLILDIATNAHCCEDCYTCDNCDRDYRNIRDRMEQVEAIGQRRRMTNPDWFDVDTSICSLPYSKRDPGVDVLLERNRWLKNHVERAVELVRECFPTDCNIELAAWGPHEVLFIIIRTNQTVEEAKSSFDRLNERLLELPRLDVAFSIEHVWRNRGQRESPQL